MNVKAINFHMITDNIQVAFKELFTHLQFSYYQYLKIWLYINCMFCTVMLEYCGDYEALTLIHNIRVCKKLCHVYLVQ
jgi:hypothetical protein